MKIKVLYFASLKDKLRKNSEELNIKENSSIKDLKELIIKKYPEVKELLEKCMVALNENYVNDEVILKDNDTIAFIPPVGGG